MEKICYARSKFDSCMYIKTGTTTSEVYLMLYVDDTLLANKDGQEINRFEERLKAEFKMKDMGAACHAHIPKPITLTLFSNNIRKQQDSVIHYSKTSLLILQKLKILCLQPKSKLHHRKGN